MKQRKLTDRQQLFIEHYCSNGYNCLQAMLKAGYSVKYANHWNTKILEFVGIKQAISDKKTEIAAQIEVTSDKIINELAKIGFQINDSLAAQDRKTRALDLLGKVKGIYEADNLQIAGETARLDEKTRREAIRIANIRLKEA